MVSLPVNFIGSGRVPLPLVGPEGDAAAALAKLAGEIMPRLDMLQQRVEDIAQTPLPARTLSAGVVAVDKHSDSGGAGPGEHIVAALARMSDEERTLALIKAARATPVIGRGWR
jgi:hypothetical protein